MRLLCVTWHYPPSSEIAGKVVYRFARALAARGHQITIVTVPAPAGVPLDHEFGRDVPNVRVERVAPWPHLAIRAGRLKKRLLPGSSGSPDAAPPAVSSLSGPTLRRRLIELYNLPDHGNGWIVPARRAIRRLVRDQKPDMMLSISPLFSAHVAALGVHRSFPLLPWWAWFHDPASEDPYGTGVVRFRERCLGRWEATVARSVTATAVTTEEIADEFHRRFERRPLVLLCGYAPADMPRAIEPPSSGPMILIHPGTLYGPRTPVPLLEAIAELRRTGRIGTEDLRLRLIGDATDLVGETPEQAIARLNLGDVVTLQPMMSQADALDAIAASHVGVLLAERQALSIPAKTFDYVGLHRPVFALADGATAAFVERHRIGIVATRATLSAALMQLVTAFRTDRLVAMTRQVVAVAPALTIDAQVARFEQSAMMAGPSRDERA
jgi:glycosyltransferase involved in cell wall biosynthesis